MKGVMFNSFTEFIKHKFGAKELDILLQKDDYPNKGGFSALGNYNSSYMYSLIKHSKSLFDCSKDEILRQFGKYAYKYLYKRLIKMHENSDDFITYSTPYDFLENLNTLHFEQLKKFYPNAKFPEFEVDRLSSNHIILRYSSFRDIPYLTYGLLEGCVAFYGYNSSITMDKTDETKNIVGKEYPVYRFEVQDSE